MADIPWEYIFVTATNSGATTITRPDGAKDIVPDQHILVTLNALGKEGWELVQGVANPDSSGTTYLMKRTPGEDSGLFEYHKT